MTEGDIICYFLSCCLRPNFLPSWQKYLQGVLTPIKKENKIFLTFKEIQMGSVAKPYMRKDFLIQYMRKCANIEPYMRRALVIYDFATHPF
jgi:hypothetical protein